MKSQVSPFSFGYLFHRMPFYHKPKQPSLGRKLKETARSKLNSPQSHAPATFSELKTKRGHGLFRGFQIQPPPPSLMCSVEGAWLNKTKIPMKQTSPKHLLPASHASAAAEGVPENLRPLMPPSWPAAAWPLHIHRITSCAKQAVYVERMPS